MLHFYSVQFLLCTSLFCITFIVTIIFLELLITLYYKYFLNQILMKYLFSLSAV